MEISSLHLTPCHPHLATSAQGEETLLLNHTFDHLGPGRTNAVINVLRNVPTLSQFKSQLKTFLFAQAFL